MSDAELDDEELERISRAWLAYQKEEDPGCEWAIYPMHQWLDRSDYETAWRFILQMCEDASPTYLDQVGMIGASALEELIGRIPEQALDWVEQEVKRNSVLRDALTEVWSGGRKDVRERIDKILIAYGKEGARK